MKKGIFEKKKTLFSRVVPRFFFDASFFVILFGIFSYAITKLSSYVSEIKNYTANLDLTSTGETEFLAKFVEMEAVSSKVYYIIYYVLPAVVFILYCIFQGLSFKNDWKYVLKFGLASIAPFIIFILLIDNFFSEAWMILLFVFLFYAAFGVYISPKMKDFGGKLWSPKTLLFYLAYTLLFLLIISLIVVLYVSTRLGAIWILFAAVWIGLVFLLSLLKEKMMKE
jgi:hypothetical protein